MSEIMEDIAYLSQEIGPRPAGTEEEQQAALYIADQVQKRTGFSANIEDFACAVHPGIVEAILFGIPAICSLLAILSRIFVIPAFLLSLVCAIFYAFELMDRPFLSRLFDRGVSQNVVAKYVPGTKADGRNRKIILVANYDSGKVANEFSGGLFNLYPIFAKASLIALIALPVIWLIRSLFLLHATGGAVLFFNFLAAIALIFALIPVVRFFMHRVATYNEAANNNATGVATVLEVARLISEGSLSEDEIAAQAEAQIHGEEAAREAGVVPEGAELEYETSAPQTEEERLAAAKAAVAALTGKPLRTYANEDVVSLISVTEKDGAKKASGLGEYGYEENINQESMPAEASAEFTSTPVTKREVAPVEEAQPTPAAGPSIPAAEITAVFPPVPGAASATVVNEPAWFTAGRAKAAKPAGINDVPPRRSRYADALDAAVSASRVHFDEAARMLDEGSIERISQMQREIESRKAAVSVPAQPAVEAVWDYPEEAEAVPAPTTVEESAALAEMAAVAEDAALAEMAAAAEEAAVAEVAAAAEEAAVTEAAVAAERAATADALEHIESVFQDFQEEAAVAAVATQAYQAEAAAAEESAVQQPEAAQANIQEAEITEAAEDAEVAAGAEEAAPAAGATPVVSASAEAAPADADAEPTFEHRVSQEAPRRTRPVLAADQIPVPPAHSEDVTQILPPISTESIPEPAPLESVMLSYEEVELLDGATTAMAPIDVSALRGEAPKRHSSEEQVSTAAKPAGPAHAFTRPDASPFARSEEARPKQRKPIIIPPLEEDELPAQEEAIQRVAPAAVEATEKAATVRTESEEEAAESASAHAEADQEVPAQGEIWEAAQDAEAEETHELTEEERLAEEEAARRAVAEKRAALRSAIPTLSGDYTPLESSSDGEPTENTEVSKTGSFAAVGSATAIEPVGDELVADLDPEDRYIEDADDSTFDDNVTETGAFAGPGYMDMPESRVSRFFSRIFKREPKEEEQSAAEWLDVDEDFNPTAVGAARGGWESFRTEPDKEYDNAELYEDLDELDGNGRFNPRSWNGGAFSLSRAIKNIRGNAGDSEEYVDAADAIEDDMYAEDMTEEEVANEAPAASAAPANEGEAEESAGTETPVGAKEATAKKAARKAQAKKEIADEVKVVDVSANDDAAIAEETKMVYNFRNPDINTEVWFVALGSENAGNGGIKAFLDAHADELRGAIIMNLEAMGAGELSFIEEEGYVITRRPSSRMKRFLRKAAEITGISASKARIDWRDSAASVAMRRGMQAMTLAGMENGKPALLGQGDDVLENIDEKMVAQHAEFVLELIKNV